MTELQIALLIAGAAVVVCIGLFNYWQERKLRKRLEEKFGKTGPDVLFEPIFDPNTPTVMAATQPDNPLTDSAESPVMEDASDDPYDPDPTTEVVIEVSFLTAPRGSDLQKQIADFRFAGRKAIRWFARRSDGVHRAWLRPDEYYQSLQAAVLLANRSGPLTGAEFSTVVARLQSVATTLDGEVDFPRMDDVLSTASDLDGRAAPLDAQVGLTLVSRAGQWSGVDVQRAGEAINLRLLEDGRFHLCDAAGQTLFSVASGTGQAYQADSLNAVRSDKLQLMLDVPRYARHDKPFSVMVAAGIELAKALHGDLVDDNNRAVVTSAIESIDQQINACYQRLEQAGFPPASERARRVFS